MDEAAEQTRHDTTQLGTIPMDTMETTSTIPQKGEEKTETTTKATIREQQRRHITAPQRKDNNTHDIQPMAQRRQLTEHRHDLRSHGGARFSLVQEISDAICGRREALTPH